MGQKNKGSFGSLFGQETGNYPLLLSKKHHKGPVQYTAVVKTTARQLSLSFSAL